MARIYWMLEQGVFGRCGGGMRTKERTMMVLRPAMAMCACETGLEWVLLERAYGGSVRGDGLNLVFVCV